MRYGIIIVGVVVLLVVLGSTLRGHDSAPYTPDASYTETTQPNTIQYGMFDFAMPVGSDTRTGVRYVPESFLSSGGAVVFVLHGGQLGSGEKVAEQTNFEEHADRDGFMVVYPDALGDQWSDGRPETDTGVDDLGYIKVLVDEVVRTHGVRTDRVFVTGISNGGMMTQWLACNQVHDFAALAPVVANLPVEAKEVCRPTQIPTVLFHGTEDSTYHGTLKGEDTLLSRGAGGTVISAEDTVSFWTDVNQCGASVLHEQIDTDPADGTSVEIYTYAGCAEELRWYKVVGGGHTWFGTDVGRIAQRIVGKPGKEIDAVDEIVAFFKNHGL